MASKLEHLFAIPGFSKLWLTPPGSPAILIRTLCFRGHLWDVKVLPTGFIRGVPDRVLVFVSLHLHHHLQYNDRQRRSAASRINVSIEILDNTWERTVFHQEHLAGGHHSLRLKRTELEITSNQY